MATSAHSNGKTVVVALGGNAILQPGQVGTFEEQLFNIDGAMRRIAALVEDGWRVVLTHGNGPQVGNLLIQNALAARTVAPMPMDVCGAESQGQIGYLAAQTLANHLRKRKLPAPVVTVVTQVAVDAKDQAFENPSKPVGPFYSEAEAKKMMLEEGTAMREDAGRGWRRVVPSPEPKEIVELEAIRDLVDCGCLVVCSGGGGVPVVRARGALSGIDAVIDKDLAAALLATQLGAQALLILTDVPRAYVNYGKPRAGGARHGDREPDARLRRAGPLQGRLHGPQGGGLPALRRRRRRIRDRQPHRGRPGDGRQGGHAHRAGRGGQEGREAAGEGRRGRGRATDEGGNDEGRPHQEEGAREEACRQVTQGRARRYRRRRDRHHHRPTASGRRVTGEPRMDGP